MAHHTGEKPLQCPHCDYKTVDNSTLKNHITAHHTAEKPHHCPHCDYRSVQYGNLKRHIMSCHTEEKPHHCSHCDYQSVSTADLKRHIMFRHKRETPHHCPYCDYKSVTSSHLKRHMKYRHKDEKPRQCYGCDYCTANANCMKFIVQRKPKFYYKCYFRQKKRNLLRDHIVSFCSWILMLCMEFCQWKYHFFEVPIYRKNIEKELQILATNRTIYWANVLLLNLDLLLFKFY